MSAEKLRHLSIKHTVKYGNLLIVETPAESRSFRLKGTNLKEKALI